MLAIPARVAGCKEIVLCTPPDKNGDIAPAILYTASLAGVDRIFKAGGAGDRGDGLRHRKHPENG